VINLVSKLLTERSLAKIGFGTTSVQVRVRFQERESASDAQQSI